MRELNDPANPYREQYAEWDYYCFANARRMDKAELKKWNSHKVPLTRRSILVNVDANGYPVPIMQTHNERMEWYRDQIPAPDGACTMSYSVYADVPELLDQRMYAAEQALRSELVPEIPRWLAVSPPLKALMLPDGSCIAYGAPGTGRQYDREINFLRTAPAVACYHYSPAGRLLAQTEVGEGWYNMFWPEAEQVLGGYDEATTYVYEDNGYIFVRQIEDWKPLAVYNYDGAPLPVETEAMSRDANIWGGWFGREIMMLYAAQQDKHMYSD